MAEAVAETVRVGDTGESEDGHARIISIDWPRTELVLGQLLSAYLEGSFPYNQDFVRLPQDPRHMPESLERGTCEHAMFLWSVCYYMRGGIKSVDAVKRLSLIYDQHPDLFVAELAAEQDAVEVGNLLRSYGLGYQYTQIGSFWVENAQRLQERWGGDPRKIFSDVNTYEESLARIQNDMHGGGFLGFQEKMVSMIIYYLMDEDLIEPFIFPLPVDLHVLRVSVANELIRFEGYGEDENILSNETLRIARQLYYEYALRQGVNPLRLCDAVWLLSQSLCGQQPGNVTLEPQGRANRNGRQTVLIPLPIDVEDPRQQEAYHRSCAFCPANDTCMWNVPGKIYYVQGELRRRGRRLHFPVPAQGTLLNWQEHSFDKTL